MIRVTVWNEYRHEREDLNVAQVYPEGIHGCIAKFLCQAGMQVGTATMDEPEHGLSQEVLDRTDVLIWWGHLHHDLVSDEVVERVYRRVVERGMGLICLHSAHASKIFQRLCGTDSSQLSWREDDGLERLFVVNAGHPIVSQLPEYFEIPKTEMYGEHFNIPAPEELILLSWFSGGEVLRSCFVLHRGRGKVMYFRPGHETLPIYYQREVMQIIMNGVKYLVPAKDLPCITYRKNIPLPKANV